MERATYTVVCVDTDPKWLTYRLSGIGGSDIAAVLGTHRKRSRIRVWAEKTGRLPQEDLSDVEAVEMGNELEPVVARRYQKKTGRTVERWGQLLRSVPYPWAICTPDYYHVTDDGTVIPVQIKTTSAFNREDWIEGPPLEVWWQEQHEMLVTGAPWASVGVLVGGQQFFWADIKRDADAIARIQEEGAAFWELVGNEVPPEPDQAAETTEVISALYAYPELGQTPLPPEALEWDATIRELQAQKKQLEGEIAYLQNHIRMSMGEAEVGILPDGSGAYTWRWNESAGYWVGPKASRTLRRVKNIPKR